MNFIQTISNTTRWPPPISEVFATARLFPSPPLQRPILSPPLAFCAHHGARRARGVEERMGVRGEGSGGDTQNEHMVLTLATPWRLQSWPRFSSAVLREVAAPTLGTHFDLFWFHANFKNMWLPARTFPNATPYGARGKGESKRRLARGEVGAPQNYVRKSMLAKMVTIRCRFGAQSVTLLHNR